MFAAVLLAAVTTLVLSPFPGTGAAAGLPLSCPPVLAGRSDLGRMAFVDGHGQLELLQVTTCNVTVLVASGARGPVSFSADGRFIAYGDGSVIDASGGEPTRPLGRLADEAGAPGWT